MPGTSSIRGISTGVGGFWAGWPRAVTRPGLPQIRTCRITAYGSSRNTFASPTAHRVNGHRVRNGVATQESDEPTHARPVPAPAASQPFPPQSPHFLPEPGQRDAVTRDPVVSTVTAEFLAECLVLLRDRPVPVVPAPLGHRPDGPGEAARRRLAFHHPIPLAGTCPVMGESQQVERPGTSRGRPPCSGRSQGRSSERNQSGLIRVDGQAVPAESLRQHVHHAPSIFFMGKSDDEVVGIPHEKRTAFQAWLRVLGEPSIQHVVQIDIGRQGRNHPALRAAVCPSTPTAPSLRVRRYASRSHARSRW